MVSSMYDWKRKNKINKLTLTQSMARCGFVWSRFIMLFMFMASSDLFGILSLFLFSSFGPYKKVIKSNFNNCVLKITIIIIC